MSTTLHQEPASHTPGLTLHAAFLYDLTVWLMTLGRERNFREKLLRLAGVKSGETVLDVGCGTGSLAITAKRWVGPAGSVTGIVFTDHQLRHLIEVFIREREATAQKSSLQYSGFGEIATKDLQEQF